MPQTAPSRAPRAGADRRARGGVSAFVVLVSLCCGFAAAGNARAQTPDGQQIYIAGPGDHGGNDAVRMSAMLSTPGGAAIPPVSLPRAPSAAGASDDASSGMITIPGPGERGGAAQAGAGAQADAPQIVTVPAPGASTPAAVTRYNANANVNALPRVNTNAAASRVASVVVEASGANASTANNSAFDAANARANAIQRYAAAVAANPNAATAAAAANPNAAANPAAVAANANAQQPVPPGQQDGESIRAAALAFLQQQSVGLPGHVTITVSPVFPRGLAACASLEPFMPPGARSWGRTTVGVRCVGAKPWTLYVAARVAVDVTYYVAARQIEPGQTVAAVDLVPREADLANLPRTVVTDPSQATGALALLRIAAGLPLRTDMLRSAASVTIGQTVKVVAVGTNFTISAEGSVLNNAAPGQQVRVRTAGGQIITGVVKDAATVEIQI